MVYKGFVRRITQNHVAKKANPTVANALTELVSGLPCRFGDVAIGHDYY